MFALSGGGPPCPPGHLKAIASLNLFGPAAHVARHNLAPPFEVWGHTPDKTSGNVPDHNAGSKKEHFHPHL
jgi:hypothetical protein